ncbi:LysR family transcriptional regulator [Selenomonas artemidis]|uniref:LysR family transcriptional regulator n=1 Tax=Selenomonas artemidis TaxID=671224 RepID=UPI00288A6A5F|nr:LysR family transcriptional regulator [Selenomonas artemidis]
MDVQDFNLLMTLARTRNITHAAEEFFITQSSISKRVRHIEKELGIVLLLRSRQGIQFTPAGEIVLDHARTILHEVNTMHRALKDRQGVVSGTLRVGVSINYAVYRLPAQLRLYRSRYPLVQTQFVTLSSQDVFSRFLAGKDELAILRGEHSDWTGPRILLGREPICVITSKEDADRPLHEFGQVTRHTDTEMARDITQWMKENHIPPAKSHIAANSTATCMEMVQQGLGWSIVPQICLARFDGSVRPMYFSDGTPLMRATYLFYTAQAEELPQVRAFIDMFR